MRPPTALALGGLVRVRVAGPPDPPGRGAAPPPCLVPCWGSGDPEGFRQITLGLLWVPRRDPQKAPAGRWFAALSLDGPRAVAL